MNGYAGFPPSPSDPSRGVLEPKPGRAPLLEDVEMSSSCSRNESSENRSTGQAGDCDDSRGPGMLGRPAALQGPNGFNLIMATSEHNPSTSGCSEQSGKADMHRELRKTLKELKVHLPADKKAKGRANTLATLKYALRSVKQVKANEEYYQLLMSGDSHPCSLNVPSYTVGEIESKASEHIVKNADMFAVAVSLVTGKILYISSQAASVFHCKRDAFTDTKFVEFLAPHDVSMFHSSTTPYKLPSWGTCSGADSFTRECMEGKSFFCRVRRAFNGGPADPTVPVDPKGACSLLSTACCRGGCQRTSPFHVKAGLGLPCALWLGRDLAPQCQPVGSVVEVVVGQRSRHPCTCPVPASSPDAHSAPRIPPEKRIFTTTHTPNCLFQDVDERVVPLLGYLPQDLVESPMLLQLHPSDRPLMLAIHRKILQSGGQPFDYSPIRFRTRNGEYITLDTSWSSFVNPWSRKISFIIGRHRVRVGPLNEDVFATQSGVEEKTSHPGIQELTEQICQLLLQPVPYSGSSGYDSLGSNGSHEHLMSQTSSSDSNGHEDTHQRKPGICKNGNRAKTKSHYSHELTEQKKKPITELQSHPPILMKAAPATDRDGAGAGVPRATFPEELVCRAQPACSYQQVSCLDSVIRYLESCSEATTLKRKCEFPASAPALNASDKRKATGASQVHTALLKPAEEKSHSDVTTHLTSLTLPGKAESVVSLTSQCSYSSTIVHVGDKKLQPELEMIEDATSGAESLDGPAGPVLSCSLGPEKEPFKKLGLTKEVLAAHTQKEEQSFLHKLKEMRKLSTFSSCCPHYLQERPRGQSSQLTAPGLRNASGMHSSWKKPGKNRKLKSKRAKLRDSSGSTASGQPATTRAPLAGLNATAWSPSNTSQSSCPAVPFPAPGPAYSLPVFPTAPHTGFAVPVGAQPDFSVQPPPFTAPLGPVMAFMLPSYPFPAVTPSLPQAFFPGQTNFPGHPEMIPISEPVFPGRSPFPTQPCACPPSQHGQLASRAATPATPSSTTGPVGRASPPIFQSRSSSPLQLNLLQLEEAPEGSAAAAGTVGTTAAGLDAKPATSQDHPLKARPTLHEPSEAQHSDALSTSSDLLDLLLNEDLCSATGSALSGSGASATSDSLGSRSLGCTVSRSGTGSSDTSHSSKYFGSIDSSENNPKVETSTHVGESEHLIRHVLQDPIWVLMADSDNSIMMTYQTPARDLAEVLKEDREKLRLLQKLQPQFTEAQKQELREVHPWVQTGGLPAAMDVRECVYCGNKGKGNFPAPHEEDIPALGLSKATDAKEENGPPTESGK
ncbi:period circadian protein homolog 2 [Trichechus manatus latirostris]|uniref:Period circadian protein homolog 2 n=1 Tax=Trichechus manatus latirostris TaxID=127582 RepID=A0A2Y9RY51_TRIMA|nr:period circadian protein homolog 2 [Trichechus manatus latirostris]